MPHGASGSCDEPQTDTRKGCRQTNVTTVGRTVTFPKNARNRRNPGIPGGSHNKQPKSPTRAQKKSQKNASKDRQETTSLGNQLRQQPPREKTVTEKEEPPYQIRTTRYDREEKIMIKVRIQGANRQEYITTALIDSGASENFIDRAYAKASGIPMQQKTTSR